MPGGHTGAGGCACALALRGCSAVWACASLCHLLVYLIGARVSRFVGVGLGFCARASRFVGVGLGLKVRDGDDELGMMSWGWVGETTALGGG